MPTVILRGLTPADRYICTAPSTLKWNEYGSFDAGYRLAWSPVRFGSHDHCHCLAGPVWDENHDVVDAYQRSPRSDRQRAAQNRLARKWIREHIRGQ